MVVAFHSVGAAMAYGPHVTYLRFVLDCGASGVDIFFVISGFVMVYTQARNPKTPSQFLINRLARIAPTYWAMTGLLLLILAIHPSAFQHLQLNLGWALRSLLFISVPFDGVPMIHVGWTLEYEMLFYAIFAASLFIRAPVWSQLACIVPLVGFALAGLMLPLEFVFGMISANVFLRNPKLPIGLPFLAAGTGLLLAAQYFEDFPRILRWGIPSFLVVMGSIYLPRTQSRLALFLGSRSYSIYLVQIFSISAFYKITAKYRSAIDGDCVAVICILVSMGVGCLIYEIVEAPASRLAMRVFSRRVTVAT